jgi:hypothetical protein
LIPGTVARSIAKVCRKKARCKAGFFVVATHAQASDLDVGREPSSVAKINAATGAVAGVIPVAGGALKSAEALDTMSVGPPGVATTRALTVPSPLYSVELLRPWLAVHTCDVAPNARPHGLIRFASAVLLVRPLPALSVTRLLAD